MKKNLLFLLLTLLVPALKCQAQVVISQVYGGGGNSGAPYSHDFIELFNAGTTPASLAGLSLQYASATGTGNFGASASQLTELPNVTLQPGQYFLVQQRGGTTGVALPTPDFIDATPIGMAAGAGKVALVTGTTSLGCNGGYAVCSPEAAGRILDMVGFGSANYFEGAGAAPAGNNTTALFRAGEGCTETNNNSNDFATGAPAPRNGQTAANPCSPVGIMLSIDDVTIVEGNTGTASATFTVMLSQPAPSGGVSFDVATADNTAAAGSDYVAGSLTSQNIPAGSTSYAFNIIINGDQESEPDETFFVNVTNVTGAAVADGQGTGTIKNDDAAPITPIYTIQGSSTASPLTGQIVTTSGVVTGDYQGSSSFNGFFIQDAEGDGNTASSDGIFVFSNIPVEAGQIVQVTGTVEEAFTQTQIGKVSGVVVQEGNVSILPTTLSLPVSSTGVLEQYEGMLVSFPQALTVSQNFTLARFGEVWLSANLDYPFNEVDGRLYNPTNFIDPTDNPASGVANATDNKTAVAAQQDLHNRSSILLDDASTVQNPATIPYLGPDNTLRVGSSVSSLTGILSYSFRAYRLQPTQAPAFNYAPRPLDPPATGNANLKIASFNVLNYFNGDGNGGGFPTPRGADNLTEFNRQRAKIIAALKAMDADVVGLIEMENDGDGALSAIADLVKGLNDATAAGTYDYIRDLSNGGRGTDAIKVAFIYKPGTVTPVGAPMADLAAVHNRPPLAQTFRLNSNGEIVTPIINHFKSKGGTGSGLNADQRDGQGNFNFDRVKQAEALVSFIKTMIIPAAGDPDVIILGDLNAYAEEDPIDVLRAAGYVSLFGPESYSYVFDKQSGSLDHALVTPTLAKQFAAGGKWHINADEPIFMDYNTEFKTAAQIADLYSADPFRSSDHDPVLVGLNLYTPVLSFAEGNVTRNEGSGAYEVTITAENGNVPYQDLLIPVTISSARDVRYGDRRDYTTNPPAETGNFVVAFPAGATKASFIVTPQPDDDNERFAENVTFSLVPAKGTDYKLGSKSVFIFTILDVKKNAGAGTATSFVIWPNPTSGPISLGLSSGAVSLQTVTVSLRSDSGEEIYSGTGTLDQMSKTISERLNNSLPGFYLIQVTAGDEPQLIRVLKQ